MRRRGHPWNGLAEGSLQSRGVTTPGKVESVRQSGGLRCKGRDLGNGQARPGRRPGRKVGCWAASDCGWARRIHFSALRVL